MINSLLDNDLYKFTMMQLVWHRFKNFNATYKFYLRAQHADLTGCIDDILKNIEHLCSISFKDSDLNYLKTLSYFKDDFVLSLRDFKLNANHIKLEKLANNEFNLIIKGPWYQTILFEVPVLAIISEVFYRKNYPSFDYADGKSRLTQKIQYLLDNTAEQHFKLADFGTRRRFSFDWHQYVICELKKNLGTRLIGTSNLLFAKDYNLTPIGTMAHEYIQAFQRIAPSVEQSQRLALTTWQEEYQGELGIALSDTLGLNQFLKDFDTLLANQYQGARQDSGDPFAWADAIIKHYQQLNIDPNTKSLVFSDGLTMPKAVAIMKHVLEQGGNPVFGIGTHLTNDVGIRPVDMVIKLVEVNQQPVAKLSDTPGKTTCIDEDYLQQLMQAIAL